MGIVVPLLPTTPFLLLAAACFIRSSDRLYCWLINHRIFGHLIASYRKYRAISLRSKIVALVLLWVTICYSAFWIVPVLWLRIVLLSLALSVSLYLISLKTLTPEMRANLKDP